MGCADVLGCCCVTFIVCLPTAISILVIVLPLYSNLHNPAFSVEEFYVQAFNKTANNASSDAISFNIKLQNQNPAVGLYYDNPVNVTISYTSIQTNDTFTWEYSVPKFYQGNGKSRRLIDEIQMLDGQNVTGWNRTTVAEKAWIPSPWATMTLLQPLQLFRIKIITKVRFKLVGNHHGKVLVERALVPIDPNTGQLFTNGAVMTSAAPRMDWSRAQGAALVVSAAITTIVFM